MKFQNIYFSKVLLSDIGFKEIVFLSSVVYHFHENFCSSQVFCLFLVRKTPLFLLQSRGSSPVGGDDMVFSLLPVVE